MDEYRKGMLKELGAMQARIVDAYCRVKSICEVLHLSRFYEEIEEFRQDLICREN